MVSLFVRLRDDLELVARAAVGVAELLERLRAQLPLGLRLLAEVLPGSIKPRTIWTTVDKIFVIRIYATCGSCSTRLEPDFATKYAFRNVFC